MARGYVGGPSPHDHTRARRSRSRRGGRGYTTGHARPRSLSCPKLTDEADLPTVNNVPMLGRLKFANTDSGSLSVLSQRAYQGCVVSLDAGTCSVDTKRSCLTGDACLRFTAHFQANSATFDKPSVSQSRHLSERTNPQGASRACRSVGRHATSFRTLRLGWSTANQILAGIVVVNTRLRCSSTE